jgi:hypothetical protein
MKHDLSEVNILVFCTKIMIVYLENYRRHTNTIFRRMQGV